MSTTEATRRTSSRIANRAAPPSSSSSSSKITTSSEGTKATNSKKRATPASSTAAPKASADKEESTNTKKLKPESKSTTTSKGGVLSVGDALPNISLKDEAGNEVNVSTLKKTVIFTYPKANTGGCTTQACLFRDEYTEWTKLGFQVFGLSNDGLTSLKNWKDKKGFQYHLLSDPKRELIGSLTGSITQTRRSHFVIDGEGKLALSSLSVKPAESSPAALKFAQSL